MHVYVKEEEWEVIYRLVIDGCCLDLFSEIEVCKMYVRNEFCVHPRIFFFSVVSVLTERMIKSARIWGPAQLLSRRNL